MSYPISFSSPESVVSLLSQLKSQSYIVVAAACLLLYDYFLTFDREISLIWTAPWSLVKIFFILARYAPFADIGLVLFYQFSPTITEEGCRTTYTAAAFVLVVGIGAAEGILLIRTSALWRNDKRLAAVLGLIYLGAATTAFVAEAKWRNSIEVHYNDAALPGFKCFIFSGWKAIAGNLGVVMVCETTVIVLTVAKLIQQYCFTTPRVTLGGLSPFVRVLYRDGLVFFAYLFVVSLANLLLVIIAGDTISEDLLIKLQHVLHSVLAVRVVLNLREANRRDCLGATTGAADQTDIAFAPGVPQAESYSTASVA